MLLLVTRTTLPVSITNLLDIRTSRHRNSNHSSPFASIPTLVAVSMTGTAQYTRWGHTVSHSARSEMLLSVPIVTLICSQAHSLRMCQGALDVAAIIVVGWVTRTRGVSTTGLETMWECPNSFRPQPYPGSVPMWYRVKVEVGVMLTLHAHTHSARVDITLLLVRNRCSSAFSRPPTTSSNTKTVAIRSTDLHVAAVPSIALAHHRSTRVGRETSITPNRLMAGDVMRLDVETD